MGVLAAAGTNAGVVKPASAPETMLPGVVALGRLPFVVVHESYCQTVIWPPLSTPAFRFTTNGGP